MSYPTLELTRFNRLRGQNYWTDAYRSPVVSDTGGITISDYMADCIKRASMGPEPRFWSFAKFNSKTHKKSSIAANTAVVLEYPFHKKSELEMQLGELGLPHFLVLTDDGQRNMVAVIVPLAMPLMNMVTSGRYSRLASVLIQQIGIEGATDGCQSCTFLIKPINNARIEAFAGNGQFLDPEAYIKETADLHAKAKTFIDPPEEQKADADLFVWPR